MRIATRAITAAAAGAVLAVLAVGCGGSSGTGGNGNGVVDQVIDINWGAEPPSLDPGLATDTTSADVITNIMDPLVKLDEKLQPVPNLAKSWDVSPDGKTVTFRLRDDGRWTNGDPVTAHDFEWSWKRTISPELGADYAYQFYGIVGAAAYNACEKDCDALRDKVGVEALDDHTLQVKLTSRQPWFVQQVAHHSFLAVHPATVEKYGNKWTEPENIVTDGPFELASWRHDAELDLVKWDGWRNADEVKLERINGKMITEGTTALRAFQAGELDTSGQGLPPVDIPRLKDTPEYQQYPGLGTYYYGLNVKTVPDVKQRRAMALAIDRQTIIDNIAQGDQLPASGFTPKGMPGFDTLTADSPWLPAHGDIAKAKELMSQVDNPTRNVTLLFNNAPGHRDIAVAVQAMWQKLGIDVTLSQQEWKQYLQFLGPPPDPSMDAFRLGWIADYPDAMNFLELWKCGSGNNNTNWCDLAYDKLVEQARKTPDNAERYTLYGQLEDKLVGKDGAMPVVPIYWYTFVQLERSSIKDTLNINPLGLTDYTHVVETDGSSA
ncbi:peptide ABC transporter substrate-binding protein [Gaiella sp.]|uniref:peptide ABC transporter substrate-binding protein n=1 Tax=Gaiella sp. TaxID=2663207 RepID=UPI002E3687C5|nr:peptide ABC transporter substrate-binding protein [Gaiella sp.]HEX5583637.1 peptide ABC transporter substrate-binding protein [Gaiella sp.]